MAYSVLYHEPKMREMVAANAAMFSKQVSTLRALASDTVTTLLVAREESTPKDKPRVLGAKGEGGSVPSPPLRDKGRDQNSNLAQASMSKTSSRSSLYWRTTPITSPSLWRISSPSLASPYRSTSTQVSPSFNLLRISSKLNGTSPRHNAKS